MIAQTDMLLYIMLYRYQVKINDSDSPGSTAGLESSCMRGILLDRRVNITPCQQLLILSSLPLDSKMLRTVLMLLLLLPLGCCHWYLRDAQKYHISHG